MGIAWRLTMIPNDPTQADPAIVALMHGIKTNEGTNGDYQGAGDKGTAAGIGQWSNQVNGVPQPLQSGQIPANFQAQAKQFGLNPDDFSAENQNKTMYAALAADKKAGLTPEQILSKWNSGDPNKYQNTSTSTGTGPVGSYDVASYVKKGMAAAQEYAKSNSAKGQILGNVPSPQIGGSGTFLGDVGNTLSDAGTGVSNALSQSLSGQINPLSGVLQGAGAVAGGVNGLVNNVLEHTPVVGGIYKGAEGLIGQGAQALASTPVGQQVVQGAQGFAQAHPELSGDIGAAANIAGAIPVFKGVGLAKDAISGGIGAALHGAADDGLYDLVSPKLGPKAAAKAVASRGTVTKGLLRETSIVHDPKYEEVENAVRENVPKIDSNKPLSVNMARTQQSIDTLKSSLKADVGVQGAGKIFPIKQLMSGLRAMEKPDVIASDSTLNNLYDRLLNRVQGIATKTGGKVENLPDMLSEFDSQVNRQFGNLWSNPNYTPMRAAVSQIREGIKTFAEDNMPNVGLKQRMLTIHHLITAKENMAAAATKGATKEVGTNAVDRFARRHPVIRGVLKAGTKAAAEGTGIGAAMRIMQ